MISGLPGQGQVQCGHFPRNMQVYFAADVFFKYIACFKIADNLLYDNYAYFDIPELTTGMDVFIGV